MQVAWLPQGKILRRLLSSDRLSHKNVQEVKDLIDTCIKHHEFCQAKAVRELPKRLIYVGSADETPRLIETQHLPQTSSYSALSHVWGDPSNMNDFSTTKIDSLEERLKGIPLRTMPQTFKDAIAVVRALDIPFIWIDSLCIIQDSESDWLSEAPRMGEVYMNALITIVATSATSAHDGFLARQPPLHPLAKIPYNCEEAEHPGWLYLRLCQEQGEYLDDELIMQIEESIWNSRGWTLQERILSKRLLHFTPELMFYECRTTNWTEDNSPPKDFTAGRPWLGYAWGDNRISEAPNQIVQSWYTIVENYSKRNLTKPSDKLPALAGLARQVEASINDEYLAGLWKSDLSSGLIWARRDEDGPKEPAPNRAPSWSWARWDGPVRFHGAAGQLFKQARSCIEILETRGGPTIYASGSVWVKVRGHLVPISKMEPIIATGRGYSHRVFCGEDLVGSCRLDDFEAWGTTTSSGFALLVQVLKMQPATGEVESGFFLLLQQDTKFPDHYRRIGTMTVEKDKGADDSYLNGRISLSNTSTTSVVKLV
jgi:hypothetical protein